MPSPGLDIMSWSVIPANNGTADPSINWAENQARASLNDSARAVMAAHALSRNLTNGSITTGGSANAQTVTSGLTYTSVPTGLQIRVKIGFTNTGATTLNLDAISAVSVLNQRGVALVGNELFLGTYRTFVYNGTNWILLEPTLAVVIQAFTASGTYTPTAGMVYCILEAVGGGGGGGGALAGATFQMMVGAGGGGGGYARAVASGGAIGASQAVTIGAAGAAGSSAPTSGATGGTTSIGALCVAAGGVGGQLTQSAIQCGLGGAGGTGTTGIIQTAGSPGASGAYYDMAASGSNIQCFSGMGGNSYFGGGAACASGTGAAGTKGGGGAGGALFAVGSFAGGAGGPGYACITEFVHA